MNNSNAIRQSFLDFFHAKGHTIVPSSPLVPANDPTLLFTNAGMVQFKDVFVGREKRQYQRAVTAQRCLRAGGKHNDLENVGYTARHHTFFEMLGNFSFGDYFKQEAIHYAWQYLTEELNIPATKLWITVFAEDDEAADIWLNDIKVSPARFSRCDEKNNFWSMGETGPCGPCSEIFYDHGATIPGGPPGTKDADLDRYTEIWNLVFTQYERDNHGNLKPIPHPSVDTGMGLERITAVMQGVHNNYETDVFKNIIQAIQQLADNQQCDQIASRVIADHIRACSFLILDGVTPANEGRGYVLRRIIRRAVRYGNKIGFNKPFFHQLLEPLIQMMGQAYPELATARPQIERILFTEEERFAQTLEQGLKILTEIVAHSQDKTVAGKDVFRLYDTYGFPVDLTADIVREQGLEVDMDGFHSAMAAQRQRARGASKFAVETAEHPEHDLISSFTGYDRLQQKTTVSALYQDGHTVQSLAAGDIGGVILLETPFYAESGGQVGDQGELFEGDVFFEVEDTKKQFQSHIHLGILRTGTIKVGDVINAAVDSARRVNIMRNHSATHLLHQALRNLLGEQVLQKGSLVAADRLRFDFSHQQALTSAQLLDIEQLVNTQIMANQETIVRVMALEQAKATGAMSLFNEKYDNQVRVLNIGGDFSCELCGGTHVDRAGDIGFFKIIAHSGIAAGIRRIEAVTGMGALAWAWNTESTLQRIATLLKSDVGAIDSKLTLQFEKTRKLEKELEQLKSKIASTVGTEMIDEAILIGGINVIAKKLDAVDPKTLRESVDQLKNKLGTAALVLATVNDQKVSLVAGVTKDSIERIKAGELVNFVAQQVGGKGGGRADLAQAGGNDPSTLDNALAQVPDWIREQLSSKIH